MATITSTQSGLWSATTTWVGGVVPVNSDAVIIASGHTVTFDVNQTGFTNGLSSLTINGTLNFKTDAITYLKMNGNITGTGSLYVGNSESDPIQRPPVGTEARCQLVFNSTGTINVPIIQMYGWYPNKEYTQLFNDVILNETQIILNDDLGLQQGDIITIGCGTVAGIMTETSKGIYTVSNYNSTTKTVTLTSGLQTARLKDDYVAIISRPIKLSRISGTAALITTIINDGILQGVCINNIHFLNYGLTTVLNNAPSGWNCKHITDRNGRCVLKYVMNCTIDSSVISETPSSNIMYGNNSCTVSNTIGINSGVIYDYDAMDGINCIVQNAYANDKGLFIKNQIAKNVIRLGEGYITDSEIWITRNDTINYFFDIPCFYNNCIINDVYNNGLPIANIVTLNNCIINTTAPIEFTPYPNVQYSRHIKIESFNHNQIKGNYGLWMYSGKIIMDNKKLKYTITKGDYPLFRDYDTILPANKNVTFKIVGHKDFPNGVIKIQIIDIVNDPLTNEINKPLAEAIMPNIINEDYEFGITYKSDTSMPVKVRILIQNDSGSGNCWFDVTDIEENLGLHPTHIGRNY